MATYRNSFYRADVRPPRNEFITTDATPESYRGFLIYHRAAAIWDIVKDDVCIGMYAGPNGARRRIDELTQC